MSFYIYDIIFLVLFSFGVGMFLWKKRDNLKREGILYLYRTQVGVKFINYVGGKYKKTLKVWGFIGVIAGYFLMIGMIYLLIEIVKIYLFMPEVVKAIKIPPIMPLIPYLPKAFNISFLPPFYFTYWILAIAVIAIFHEFAHGIFMKLYNVKIKSTGFGFLGPFLAAFVEQDEEDMEKKPKYEQIVILSAGVFANLVLAILFLLMLSGFFVLAYVPGGYMFTDYSPVIIDTNSMEKIDGKMVQDSSSLGILRLIDESNLTDDLILGTDEGGIKFTKIIAGGETYYMNIEVLKTQLGFDYGRVKLYGDYPAINVGLKGVVIKIDNFNIKDSVDLKEVLKKYSPGDEINIVTRYEGEVLSYDLTLSEHPQEAGKPYLGVMYEKKARLLSQVTDMFNFFKKSGTYYEARFNADLIVFIYNLIWWLALINLSVALVNMWPVAIFDGGRMFYLTVWAVTKSEKFAKFAFSVSNYLILGSLFLLMFGWAIAWF